MSVPAKGRAVLCFKGGARAYLIEDRVLKLPQASAAEIKATKQQQVIANPAGVVQGKRAAASRIDHKFVHATFAHLSNDRLKHLHEVCSDIPEEWTRLLREAVCDHCLRADAIKLPPSGHLPKDEGMLVMDVWYTRVAFIHGGMHYVIGFTHFVSGAKKSYRIGKKSDAPRAIRAAVAWFDLYLGKRGLRVTWLHTDNAPELAKSDEIRTIIEELKVRVTTIAAGNPRANPQERTFRTLAAGTRKYLLQLEGPPTARATKAAIAPFWGYAWEEYEAVLNLCPSTEKEHASPLLMLSGEKQQAAARRPFGCLMYVNDPEKGDKVTSGASTAERGLCVGYNHEQIQGPEQLLNSSHSYVSYCPALREKVWCGINCRFVTDCFPGIWAVKQGGYDADYIPSPTEIEEASGDELANTTNDDHVFEGEPLHNWLMDNAWTGESANETEDGDNSALAEEENEAGPTDEPDPAPPGSTIEVLYDLDGQYYKAKITSSHKTKVSREWRHTVEWAGSSEAGNKWKPQTLNLSQEQWRHPVGDGGVASSKPMEASEPPSGVKGTPPPPDEPAEDAPATAPPIERPTTPPPVPAMPKPSPLPSIPPPPSAPERSPRPIDEQSIGARVAARRRGITVGAAKAEVFLAAVEAFEYELTAALGVAAANGLDALETQALVAAIEVEHASPGSAHQTKARQEYAALVALAALDGRRLPALDSELKDMSDWQSRPAAALAADEFEAHLFVDECREEMLEALAAVKSSGKKSKQGVVTYRQQLKSPRCKEWYDSRVREIAKIKGTGGIEVIRSDDKRMVEYLAAGNICPDTMLTGLVKYDAQHNEIDLRNRCCVRGDQMTNICDNEKTSPAIRCEGIKCCEANKCCRGQSEFCFDYEAAYMQATQRKMLIVRPPFGHREFDEDGTELYWLLHAPLYGQADAGLAWNETINAFLTDPEGCAMIRGDAEPGLYSKRVGKELAEQLAMSLYVDDGKLYFDPTPVGTAEAERLIKLLKGRWKIKVQERDQADTYLLSANIHRHSSSWTSVALRTYIEKAVREHLPRALEDYPAKWGENPCDKSLMHDYEAALAKADVLTGPEAERFGTITGVLQFASGFRPDVSFPVGIGGRCRTFPTAKMLENMERVLVYLGRTASLATNYKGDHPDARVLSGYCDADWYVRRSTTGYVIMLAGGAVSHGSHRQHCIAMSTTEAELMGLAELALEMLYVRDVLAQLGFNFEPEDLQVSTKRVEVHRLIHQARDIVHGPIGVHTDNSGAYNLCHRTTVGKNSKHVERRVYKMRELQHQGIVKVNLIPTAEMPADLLTKALDDKTFHRHRKTIMNLC